MENQKKKCSSKKHSEIDAIYYCQECKIYLCNKCQNYHSELFETHHFNNNSQWRSSVASTNNINKNIDDIFTGYCKEKEHNNKLKFFCKNHNQLCCAACTSKIKDDEYGQHKDCDVCPIKEIKDIKKNKLKENIKYLEDLSNKLEQSINELKILFEKINEKKEALKLKIQNYIYKNKKCIK